MHGLVRNLVNGDSVQFIRNFRSFLGQCPSFLHSVGQDRFFSTFFFGMFATAHDSGLLEDSEKVFFKFDDSGNLKVALLTVDKEKRKVVRCFTFCDRQNSPESRFNQEDIVQVEDVLRGQVRNGTLFEEYKVFAWMQSQADVYEEEEEIECTLVRRMSYNDVTVLADNPFNEITRISEDVLENDTLIGLVGNLADSDAVNVQRNAEEILKYILLVYDTYSDSLNFRNVESNYHGFLSGFLMNFKYFHMAGIYLELFVGSGYTDITLLVRGAGLRGDSVPIVIELKAGQGTVAAALRQAKSYVNVCPVSSLPIYTSSRDAVCVGLNFCLNRRRFGLDIGNFLNNDSRLLERLFEPIDGEEFEENIRDCLTYPAFGVPAVPGVRGRDGISAGCRRIFFYMTGFSFGNIAFDRGTVQFRRNHRTRVNKYLFSYEDNDVMLGPKGGSSQVNVGRRALTMVLHVKQGRNRKKEDIVIFNVHHSAYRYDSVTEQYVPTYQMPNQYLNLLQRFRGRDVDIYDLTCRLDSRSNGRRFTVDDPAINLVQYPSLGEYTMSFDGSFQGNLVRIGGVSQIHRSASTMMNIVWRNIVDDVTSRNIEKGKYSNFFRLVSDLLVQLKWFVGRYGEVRELGFHSVMHGLFYVCDNPERVISEFQVGGGGKIDLVLILLE